MTSLTKDFFRSPNIPRETYFSALIAIILSNLSTIWDIIEIFPENPYGNMQYYSCESH